MHLTDKKTFLISFIILFVALGIYWYGQADQNRLPHGFQIVESPDVLANQYINNWSTLPVATGVIESDWWEKELLVIYVFKMSDCGICLARADEILSIAASFQKHEELNFEIMAVGISKNPAYLDRFLTAAPKPCVVLRETPSEEGGLNYGATPKIIIIDRRAETRMASMKVGAEKITADFVEKLSLILKKGF